MEAIKEIRKLFETYLQKHNDAFGKGEEDKALFEKFSIKGDITELYSPAKLLTEEDYQKVAN